MLLKYVNKAPLFPIPVKIPTCDKIPVYLSFIHPALHNPLARASRRHIAQWICWVRCINCRHLLFLNSCMLLDFGFVPPQDNTVICALYARGNLLSQKIRKQHAVLRGIRVGNSNTNVSEWLSPNLTTVSIWRLVLRLLKIKYHVDIMVFEVINNNGDIMSLFIFNYFPRRNMKVCINVWIR